MYTYVIWCEHSLHPNDQTHCVRLNAMSEELALLSFASRNPGWSVVSVEQHDEEE